MPTLTELQIAAMRGAIVGVPERVTIPHGYPPTRRSRRRTTAQQGEEGIGEGGALPIDAGVGSGGAAVLWPFLIQTAAGAERTTVVSPRYTGPGLIDFMVATIVLVGGSPTAGLSVLYSSDNSGAGFNLANSPPPLGTSIFQGGQIATDGGQTLGEQQHLPVVNTISDTILKRIDFGVRVMLAEFFVKVSFRGVGAGASTIQGYIRIVENVTQVLEAV